jgi:signal transduction histidine kinase
MIGNSGKYLLSLIENVLDLSRVEAGQVHMDVSLFSPIELAQEAAAIMQPMAAEKGLRLVASGDDERHLRSDRRKVKQILLNLIGNAVKFTESGSVTLHVARDEDGDWDFEVRDTGPGIAEEDQPRVFEAFRQLDSSSVAKTRGAGLGLSLSRTYAEMLGGSLTLESKLGAGSTFTLTLGDYDGEDWPSIPPSPYA